jgi:hypothetical protein
MGDLRLRELKMVHLKPWSPLPCLSNILNYHEGCYKNQPLKLTMK